jgi:hypothetical protein
LAASAVPPAINADNAIDIFARKLAARLNINAMLVSCRVELQFFIF